MDTGFIVKTLNERMLVHNTRANDTADSRIEEGSRSLELSVAPIGLNY